jgi:hypothetical protein
MILIGKQGTAKSTLCRTLAMQDEWFTDSVAFDGSPQNIVPQLFGKLVVELAELDGMAKKEVQHIKAFITRQSDNVTLKYKAFASDFSRRCIFIGTSNEDSPLVDITGNRRFLPVRVPAKSTSHGCARTSNSSSRRLPPRLRKAPTFPFRARCGRSRPSIRNRRARYRRRMRAGRVVRRSRRTPKPRSSPPWT